MLLGGLLFLLLSLALRLAITLAPAAAGSAWGRFLTTGLGSFLSFWGGLKLFLRLGLYQKEKAEPAQ